ncbi:hypothetical protein SAMD00019534_044220 [Acytostelium subglobosum LB1]|uniref:hypothetical protein n=1 Tax=Acytostelium subglobosum LB1 TaxID=1410327 RepID=UPI000644A11F|nr:hypothetical protein SAMD00019534_044220 [Acytostelium subglobosum LB1]GAM21247.1 hypothetical protein SAMD00019534_044220 [Acytostelium subglobosum LB1]|eukprot:XP_012755366.1 hypothetical protein SAMD00019534_044220 [Acytostelium subglobosum LB1]
MNALRIIKLTLLLSPIPIGLFLKHKLNISLVLDRDKNNLLLVDNSVENVKSGDEVTLINPKRPNEIIVRTVIEQDNNSFFYPTNGAVAYLQDKLNSKTSTPFPKTLIKGKVIASLYCLGPFCDARSESRPVPQTDN